MKPSTMMLILGFAALVEVVGPLRAEQPAPDVLVRLRQSSSYGQQLLATAATTASWSNERCPAIKIAKGTGVAVLKAPIFDNKGALQSGAWVEHLAAEGCGPPRDLSVLILAEAPAMARMVPLLPGSTHADPVLQKDGAFYAFAGAAADPKGCKPVYIAATRFVAPLEGPPLLPGKPGWTEVWTVAQCDKRSDVDMRFMPDATGTTISAHMATTAP